MPAKNAVTNLKPLVPNPPQPHLRMVHYVAAWVAPFPRSQHSPPPQSVCPCVCTMHSFFFLVFPQEILVFFRISTRDYSLYPYFYKRL